MSDDSWSDPPPENDNRLPAGPETRAPPLTAEAGPKFSQAAPLLLGLVGAALGGTAGFFLFGWILQQGIYVVILPGWLLGVGAGRLSQGESKALPAICAVLALPVGLLAEWWHMPFVDDASLTYFLAHARPMTWIMVGLGCVFAYQSARRGSR